MNEKGGPAGGPERPAPAIPAKVEGDTSRLESKLGKDENGLGGNETKGPLSPAAEGILAGIASGRENGTPPIDIADNLGKAGGKEAGEDPYDELKSKVDRLKHPAKLSPKDILEMKDVIPLLKPEDHLLMLDTIGGAKNTTLKIDMPNGLPHGVSLDNPQGDDGLANRDLHKLVDAGGTYIQADLDRSLSDRLSEMAKEKQDAIDKKAREEARNAKEAQASDPAVKAESPASAPPPAAETQQPSKAQEGGEKKQPAGPEDTSSSADKIVDRLAQDAKSAAQMVKDNEARFAQIDRDKAERAARQTPPVEAPAPAAEPDVAQIDTATVDEPAGEIPPGMNISAESPQPGPDGITKSTEEPKAQVDSVADGEAVPDKSGDNKADNVVDFKPKWTDEGVDEYKKQHPDSAGENKQKDDSSTAESGTQDQATEPEGDSGEKIIHTDRPDAKTDEELAEIRAQRQQEREDKIQTGTADLDSARAGKAPESAYEPVVSAEGENPGLPVEGEAKAEQPPAAKQVVESAADEPEVSVEGENPGLPDAGEAPAAEPVIENADNKPAQEAEDSVVGEVPELPNAGSSPVEQSPAAEPVVEAADKEPAQEAEAPAKAAEQSSESSESKEKPQHQKQLESMGTLGADLYNLNTPPEKRKYIVNKLALMEPANALVIADIVNIIAKNDAEQQKTQKPVVETDSSPASGAEQSAEQGSQPAAAETPGAGKPAEESAELTPEQKQVKARQDLETALTARNISAEDKAKILAKIDQNPNAAIDAADIINKLDNKTSAGAGEADAGQDNKAENAEKQELTQEQKQLVAMAQLGEKLAERKIPPDQQAEIYKKLAQNPDAVIDAVDVMSKLKTEGQENKPAGEQLPEAMKTRLQELDDKKQNGEELKPEEEKERSMLADLIQLLLDTAIGGAQGAAEVIKSQQAA